MSQNNWKVVTNHCCSLGEGPVWDKRQNIIFWVDILKGQVHYFYPETNELKTCDTGQMLGAIALKKSGGLIAAVKSGFAMIDVNSGAIDLIAGTEAHLRGNRFNDGKCDPAGRFWAGTMSLSNTSRAGSLYALEKDFTVKTKLSGVTCSNGMAWSRDYKIFYYIDTPTRKVAAYDYDVTTGNITGMRIVIDIPEGQGYPDGMTIDTEGMLWIALWDGWKVARYDPFSGEQLGGISLPVSRVTSCVFGGDTMDDMYITSARDGLSEKDLNEQPLAGSLFVIKKCGFKGMEGFEYNG